MGSKAAGNVEGRTEREGVRIEKGTISGGGKVTGGPEKNR